MEKYKKTPLTMRTEETQEGVEYLLLPGEE